MATYFLKICQSGEISPNLVTLFVVVVVVVVIAVVVVVVVGVVI